MFLSRHEGELENNQSEERRNRSQEEVTNGKRMSFLLWKTGKKNVVIKYSRQRKNLKVLWVLNLIDVIQIT